MKMNTKANKGTTKRDTGTDTTPGVVTSFEVTRASQYDWGTVFTLVLNGVTINNCRVGERHDGEAFISLPQVKGSDGKWRNVVYFRFADEDQEAILQAVVDALGDAPGGFKK